MAKYFNLRIATDVADRMKPHAAALEWTPNHFAETCVKIICDMIEDKTKRTLPDLVFQLDAIAVAKINPTALASKYASFAAARDEPSARVAEDPPKKRRGKH